MLTLLLHTIQKWFQPAVPAAAWATIQPQQRPGHKDTRRGRRQSPTYARAVPFLALALLALAGCAKPSSALAVIPATGSLLAAESAQPLEVREYALIEQSKDNPTHLGFQERVPAAVAAHREGWHLPGMEAALQQPNLALAGFGFEIRPNQAPPYSGYTLYQHGEALQPDIAAFWPVSLELDRALGSQDFRLPFVTLSGEKWIASAAGITPWPSQAAGDKVEQSAPVYYGDQIAYAQAGGGAIAVFDGPGLLYPQGQPETSQPQPGGARTLYTWGGPEANQHWALVHDGRVVMDGRDLAQHREAARVYEFHVLDSRPLYFYEKDGLTFLHFDGRDLPSSYDQVVYQNNGDLSVFNPGTAGRVMWFYALRDGLWYYVEAGIYD